jgi:hypothetical protein
LFALRALRAFIAQRLYRITNVLVENLAIIVIDGKFAVVKVVASRSGVGYTAPLDYYPIGHLN